jgi:hypothetical protein
MKNLTKRKAISYLLAIFLAGAATGALVGYTSVKHKPPPPPPRPEEMAGHIIDRLKTKLGLSGEQLVNIEPLVQQACAEMQVIQRESGKRVGQVFQDLNQRMAEYLTAEQKVKLDEMERERQEFWRKRSRPPGKPPGFTSGKTGSNCPPALMKR